MSPNNIYKYINRNLVNSNGVTNYTGALNKESIKIFAIPSETSRLYGHKGDSPLPYNIEFHDRIFKQNKNPPHPAFGRMPLLIILTKYFAKF